MGRKVWETCFGAVLPTKPTLLECIVCFLGMAFGRLSLDAPYRRVSRNELCEGVEMGREHSRGPRGGTKCRYPRPVWLEGRSRG